MTPILIVAILILVIGALSGATMSAFRKEKRSIESHKRLLGLMEEISTSGDATTPTVPDPRSVGQAHVRPIRAGESVEQRRPMVDIPIEAPREARPYVAPQRMNAPAASVKENMGDPLTTPEDATIQMNRVVIDDLAPSSTDRTSVPFGGSPPKSRAKAGGRHVASSAQVKVASLVALIVLGVGSVTAAVFYASNAKPSHTTTNSLASSSKKPKSTTSSTTTTAAPAILTAVSSDSSGATYALPSGSVSVVLHATAPCWVEQSTTPGGTIQWAQTLGANQSYTLTATNSLWLRTGNVGVLSITVNGVPVRIQAPPGPYNFTFSTTA